MKQTALIRVDKQTLEQLRERASGMPVATYLRDFVGNTSIDKRLAAIEETLKKLVPDDTLLVEKDIREEARELGEKLGYGPKRMKALEIVLEKGSDIEIKGAVKYMRDRVVHPERDIEFYKRQTAAEIAVHFKSNPNKVMYVSNIMAEFEGYLSSISPKIAKYVREYVYNKIRTIDINSISDTERFSLIDFIKEALVKYKDEKVTK